MRQLQGNLPKACFRTPREVDEIDVVHSCFFSKGVFRDSLKYVSGLFETQIAQENTETTIKKFSNILSNCILDRKVNVFAHSKHNKNRIAQHNGMEIYKNNQKLIIPSNVFEKLCSSYNISLIS